MKRFKEIVMKFFALVGGVAVVVLLNSSFVQAESQRVAGARYAQTIKSEYMYNTGEVEFEKATDKRIWDYLSFFAIKSDTDNGHSFQAEEATELRAKVREIARQLMTNAQESIADEYVITINSFVNLGDLYKTSSFGRYIAEQLIGELQMAGVEVIDVRKASGLMVHEKHGEYGLSREMGELSYVHASQAMVVGTYTYAQGQIFLNARLLQNNDGMVLSNASLVFDLDPVTRQMLSDESIPARRGSVVTVGKFTE